MHHDNRPVHFLLGALAGGTVAALTTLLFTTKKGAQIRDKVIEKYHQVEDSLSDAKDSVVEHFTDVKHKVEEATHDVAKKVAKIRKDD